ncbi:hypothetical protein H0G86_009514 [Trichoderma simmonsii]|uniref:Uncharacterized protein n=1 Tax=Trichoderma simmonsii TaxID=1491479 RepID=A0A8G0PH96_9HYPO|nr:hypothetical protein H0G86_009514 [Trichoderma simmonsii]
MGCQAPPSSCTWANGELDIISTSRALPWRFVHISRRLVLARTIVRASDRSSKDRLLILASNSHHRKSVCKRDARRKATSQTLLAFFCSTISATRTVTAFASTLSFLPVYATGRSSAEQSVCCLQSLSPHY